MVWRPGSRNRHNNCFGRVSVGWGSPESGRTVRPGICRMGARPRAVRDTRATPFLRVTYASIMATVKQVERRIEKIEGFRVQILHGRDRRDVRSDKGGVTQYPYERALKGSNHVKAWRDHRFAKHYPGFEVQVLNASGHVAHGGTLLTTVRDTYLDD